MISGGPDAANRPDSCTSSPMTLPPSAATGWTWPPRTRRRPASCPPPGPCAGLPPPLRTGTGRRAGQAAGRVSRRSFRVHAAAPGLRRPAARDPRQLPVKQLSGKAAVVAGGASGIGRALADAFCREGMHVAIGDVGRARPHPGREQPWLGRRERLRRDGRRVPGCRCRGPPRSGPVGVRRGPQECQSSNFLDLCRDQTQTDRKATRVSHTRVTGLAVWPLAL